VCRGSCCNAAVFLWTHSWPRLCLMLDFKPCHCVAGCLQGCVCHPELTGACACRQSSISQPQQLHWQQCSTGAADVRRNDAARLLCSSTHVRPSIHSFGVETQRTRGLRCWKHAAAATLGAFVWGSAAAAAHAVGSMSTLTAAHGAVCSLPFCMSESPVSSHASCRLAMCDFVNVYYEVWLSAQTSRSSRPAVMLDCML
jgi:hypothetical protein